MVNGERLLDGLRLARLAAPLHGVQSAFDQRRDAAKSEVSADEFPDGHLVRRVEDSRRRPPGRESPSGNG